MRTLLIPLCLILIGCSDSEHDLIGDYEWTTPSSTVQFFRSKVLDESWLAGGYLSLKTDSTFTLSYPSGNSTGTWLIEGDSLVLIDHPQTNDDSTFRMKKYEIKDAYLKRRIHAEDKNLIEVFIKK